MPLPAAIGLMLATVALGLAAGSRASERRDEALVLSGLAGCLVLFLAAMALEAVGLRWQRSTLVPLVLFGLIASWHLRGGAVGFRGGWRRPGWGEAIAVAALAIYTVCTLLQWNLHADFVYHWGVKGQRFFLAEGLDTAHLSAPWNVHIHPDYPLLLPILFAWSAIFGGAFDAVPMALWSVLFFATTLLAQRCSWRRSDLPHGVEQLALASTALVMMMFGVGYQLAGGADWLIAAAVTAGLLPLTARPGRIADRQVALIAAFASASKIEGMVFGALLVALHLGRRWTAARRRQDSPFWREIGAAAARSCWLPLVVVGLWATWCWRYGWWLDARRQTLELEAMIERAPEVLGALWHSLLTVNWHGFALLLLLLPAFLFHRRWRPVATLLLLQLAFYVAVYLSTPLDAVMLVETSAARLTFHLMPATLVLVFAALGRKSVEQTVG